MNPHDTQEQESVKAPTQPTLCINGCGFFANPACSDMCSKCYRDNQASAAAKAMATEVAANLQTSVQTGALPQPTPPPAELAAPEVPKAAEEASSSVAAEASPAEDQPPKQKNPNRCFECNKRVGYTGFSCRCGYIYCATHRYAEKHNCTFDYKGQGRERLASSNPQIVASKINKI